jgi:hypothetical protein
MRIAGCDKKKLLKEAGILRKIPGFTKSITTVTFKNAFFRKNALPKIYKLQASKWHASMR